MNAKRLTRSRDDRMLAGVCGGLGEYFNIDATLIRLGFAFFFFVGAGSPFLLYLLIWLIVPDAGITTASPSETLSAGVDEIAKTARQFGEDVRSKVEQMRTPESVEPDVKPEAQETAILNLNVSNE